LEHVIITDLKDKTDKGNTMPSKSLLQKVNWWGFRNTIKTLRWHKDIIKESYQQSFFVMRLKCTFISWLQVIF